MRVAMTQPWRRSKYNKARAPKNRLLVDQAKSTNTEQPVISTNMAASNHSYLLPTDILEEILDLLPAKSIERFRSVSKSLLSLLAIKFNVPKLLYYPCITNSSKYGMKSSDDKGLFTGVVLSDYSVGEVKNQGYMAPELFSGVVLSDQRVYFFVGSCNGLVCFDVINHCRKLETFVWNPFTCICRRLPHRNIYACGFGFDSASNDYKVFAATDPLLDPRPGDCKVEIFSLKTGGLLPVHSKINLQIHPPVTSTSTTSPPLPPSTQTYPINPNQNLTPTLPYFSKWSRKTVLNAIDNNLLISIYVTNFPARWVPMDLHLVMSRYGEVMDVYIPRKPNRDAKRYAFVRFKNNTPTQHLTQRINSLHVDGIPLEASVAKNRRISTGKPAAPTNVPGANGPGATRVTNPNHKSFAEAVSGNSAGNISLRQTTLPTPPTLNKIFFPKNSSPAWLETCALGVLKKPIPFKSLSTIILTNVETIVKVLPIGGVSFLIRFNSSEDIHNATSNMPSSFKELFNVFRPWTEGDAAFNRLCWVHIKGSPPYAWSRDFFQAVTSRIGSMVDWSRETMSIDCMDVAEILVLTNSSCFINCALTVSVGDKSFDIGVVESQSDPLGWDWSSLQFPRPSSDEASLASTHARAAHGSSLQQRMNPHSPPHNHQRRFLPNCLVSLPLWVQTPATDQTSNQAQTHLTSPASKQAQLLAIGLNPNPDHAHTPISNPTSMLPSVTQNREISTTLSHVLPLNPLATLDHIRCPLLSGMIITAYQAHKRTPLFKN
ncbi:hypothetical protein Tsubulata_047979 [Turnera subulata]|uniref:RRM domain-containing protein n=1 Tax=Turnera subulata TaxID=218843 RepID=A0A9Q0J4W1_9ROSI|nr:hypothetical protein Tsubulata_047979 [Turnera subulata]